MLCHWDRSEFIRPSYRRRGKYRLYTFADILQLWIILSLRKLRTKDKKKRLFGHSSLQKIEAGIKKALPQVMKPLVEIVILVQGTRVLVSEGALIIEGTLDERSLVFVVRDLRELINKTFPEPMAPASICR